YACVALIAGSIAQLPLPVYRRVGDTREKADHDLWWLLNEQMAPVWPAAAGWEFLVSQMLLRGDGIGYVKRKNEGRTRNGVGEIEALIPWPRDRVDIFEQERADIRDPRRLGYRFHDGDGYFTADQ